MTPELSIRSNNHPQHVGHKHKMGFFKTIFTSSNSDDIRSSVELKSGNTRFTTTVLDPLMTSPNQNFDPKFTPRRSSVVTTCSVTSDPSLKTITTISSIPRYSFDPDTNEHIHYIDPLKCNKRGSISPETPVEFFNNIFGKSRAKPKKNITDDAFSIVPEWAKTSSIPNDPKNPMISFDRIQRAMEFVQYARLKTQQKRDNQLAPSEHFSDIYGTTYEILGKGSFGTVHLSIRNDLKSNTKQYFAVKEFKKKSTEKREKYIERLVSEFIIGSSIQHVNFARVFDFMKNPNGEYFEVIEYCNGGDLCDLIKSVSPNSKTAMPARPLATKEVNCLFKQILTAVGFLHSNGIAHCDLKPENILLTKNGSVKISDFGNACVFHAPWEDEVHYSRGCCGSLPYIAPEEYCDDEDQGFDPRCADVWALGILYMIMRTGTYLWSQADEDEDESYKTYLKVRNTKAGFKPIEETIKTLKGRSVIYLMLHPIPKKRITLSQVLESAWVKNITVCKAGLKGL